MTVFAIGLALVIGIGCILAAAYDVLERWWNA